jgi:nitrite reductase/ring-hydroxylating ferredoxin subunit
MTYYHQAAVQTYAQAKRLYGTCRFPDKGKPVKGWCRLHKVDENFELRMDGKTICVFAPDNTLTFTLTSAQAKNYSITLSQALARAIPIGWERVALGRHRVVHTMRINGNGANRYEAWRDTMKAEGIEVFNGIKFNLDTGECMNAKPTTEAQVIPAKRSDWLRALRVFKRGLKVRAKLGVLDTICQDVMAERRLTKTRYDWVQPDWSNEKWIDLLFNSIKNNQHPTELLQGFVQSVRTYHYTTINKETTLQAADSVCAELSVQLRRKFGVFGDDEDEYGAIYKSIEQERAQSEVS